MKKKIIPILSAILCATTLVACSDTDKKVSFSGYWYKDINVLPTKQQTETLVYDVSFTEAAGTQSAGYDSIDYDGTYTTTLKRVSEGYQYTTLLDVTVSFVIDGEVMTETDKVSSTVTFTTETDGFRPIASEKTLVNHAPINNATKETYCTASNYTITTVYDNDGEGGKCTIVNNENEADQTKSFEIDADEYTYLDNEQLLFALRGVNPSVSASPSFLVYDAFKDSVYNINAAYGSAVTGKSFTFNKNGAAHTGTVDYYAVSLSIDAEMPGTSQTIWVAKTTNAQSNTYRNVILRMENPLYYSMGTLVYELTDATFAE